MKRNLLLLIGLAVAVIAVAVFGMDHSRVVVARGDLQNQVNRVAGEARERIGANAVLAIELTGPEGNTRQLDLEVPVENLTGDLLAAQTPMDSILTGVKMNAVRVVPPQPETVVLKSQWFRGGKAEVVVEKTDSGAVVNVTATARAGWFGRVITAAASEQFDGSETYQNAEAVLRDAVVEAARQVAQRKTSFPVKVVFEEPGSTAGQQNPGNQPGDEPSLPGAQVGTEPQPADRPSTPAVEPTVPVESAPAVEPPVSAVDPEIWTPPTSSGYKPTEGIPMTSDELWELIRQKAEEERAELERLLREKGVIP